VRCWSSPLPREPISTPATIPGAISTIEAIGVTAL
jgi:hypothetical protein